MTDKPIKLDGLQLDTSLDMAKIGKYEFFHHSAEGVPVILLNLRQEEVFDEPAIIADAIICDVETPDQAEVVEMCITAQVLVKTLTMVIDKVAIPAKWEKQPSSKPERSYFAFVELTEEEKDFMQLCLTHVIENS